VISSQFENLTLRDELANKENFEAKEILGDNISEDGDFVYYQTLEAELAY